MFLDSIKDLLGKRLVKATLIDDQEFRLDFEDGRYARFGVDGDCCSQSWIEHFGAPDDLEGATLLSVGDSDIVEEIDHPDHECLRVYNTHFKTDKGDIVLEYRNSSNGYYGGYLSRISE